MVLLLKNNFVEQIFVPCQAIWQTALHYMSVCKQDKLGYILHLFVLCSLLFSSRTHAEKFLVTKVGSDHLILLARYTNSMMNFLEMDFQKKFFNYRQPLL